MRRYSIPNPYCLVGDVAFLALLGRSGEVVAEAAIDKDDLTRVRGEGRWRRLLAPSGSYYVWNDRLHTSLHRFLLRGGDGVFGDHKNGNPLDCRSINLRSCTRAENNQNLTNRARNSTSGFRNVTWDKRANRWGVYVKVNHRKIFIGRFGSLDAAVVAAAEARATHLPASIDRSTIPPLPAGHFAERQWVG